MKFTLTFLLIYIEFCSFSQENKLLQKTDWNGYTQLRAASNFKDFNSFSLRRMKLWIKSAPEFSDNWSYKIQSTITSLKQEKFFLQDVKVGYKKGLFSFDFGQFVPSYSLEWSQPDWKISTIERAKVIDAITPSGSLGVRDLGIQANFHTKNNLLQTSVGIFNGYGIKEYSFSGQGYMISHKTAINITVKGKKIKFGYSLQYRKAENLKIKKVLSDTLAFSGKDFRYNAFARFENKYMEIQAEYLNADFNGKIANGYYLLASFNIKKSQFVFSYEDYKDLISITIDKPYYHIGYNYLFNKNKIKLFIDETFQIVGSELFGSVTSVQLQVFFK